MSATTIRLVTKRDLDELAREIQHEHQAVELALRDSLGHARSAGELLLEAKEKLPHGAFMTWVEANCAFAHRTATLYMTVARGWDHIEAHWQHVANFGLVAAARWLSGGDEPQKDIVVEDEQPACSAVMVRVESLKPHPRNYKQHPPDQIEHLVRSIEAVGCIRPVVVARDNTILAGHGLVQAATEMGRTRVPVVRLDLDPNEPRALKVLAGDNEMGLGADRDPRALTELLKELKDRDDLVGTGYDEMQLANLVHTTRMRSEIPDFDAAAEWVGMPEYDREGTPIRLIITFPTEADRAKYVEEHRVKVSKHSDTLKVWSARWPEAERNDLSAVKWTTDEAGDLVLVQVAEEVTSPVLREMLAEFGNAKARGASR